LAIGLVLLGVALCVAGCGGSQASNTTLSGAPVSELSSTTSPMASVTTGTPAVTSTTEAATTTSLAPETTTSTTSAVLDTTTTLGPVQVTNESGTSACLIKDVFTRSGKNYLVVDYVSVAATPRTDDEKAQIITNDNPKLRTFLIPAGADLEAYAIITALHGQSAQPRPITVDELKQAVAKGIINSRAGYGFWYVTVSKGRVVTLTNDFG
jgi:hypothetical protein